MCDLGDIVWRNEMLVNLGSQRMNNQTHRKKRQIFLEENDGALYILWNYGQATDSSTRQCQLTNI